MGHRDVLIRLLPVALLALSCAPSAPRIEPTKPESDRSGVELGAAQIERVEAMGLPGALGPDPSNRFADALPAAKLGQWLFFDTAFSANGEISCATCHQPERAFTDGLTVTQGLARGIRNAPTLLDVAHQTWFNWDGRFDSLWSQSHGPFSHPREMGGSLAAVVERVRTSPQLAVQYESIFGPLGAPPLTPGQVDLAIANIGKAIAAYERRLVTGPSAFDRWVELWRAKGSPRRLDLVENDGFSPSAQRGLDTFTSRGLCWQCHVGPLLSDGEFHALGAAPRGDLISDPGRYGAIAPLKSSPFRSSGSFADNPDSERARVVDALVAHEDQWGAFRTPALRNVARTAPYFHQGQFASLEEVLRFYSTLEGAVTMDHHRESVLRRRDFSAEEMADLAAFLRSLDGTDPPRKWLADPWTTHPK
ncbi:MAG: hypothetical protein EXS03_02060 [Phycisphaerales bacterium]|nr:hypothetical protein [Phycisphaerales bacterium]